MNDKILKRALKSRNLQNHDSAIFQLSFYNHQYKDFLLGIFYYELGNTKKAISLFEKYATVSSKYYEGMCYKKEQNYSEALRVLSEITDHEVLFDIKLGNDIDQFLISECDVEYINELLGDCFTNNLQRIKGLLYYKLVVDKYPLINSFNNLLLENKQFELKKMNIPEIEYFHDRMVFYHTLKKNPEDKQIQLIKKYKKMGNALTLYFISEAARDIYENNQNEEAVTFFEYIRRKDPNFLNNLDFYSTILWHSKSVSKLIVLSTFMCNNHPNSYITWTVLGNYCSLKSDINRSILSFKRSIKINPHWYAFSLLGHEHVAKQDFIVAQSYFTSSYKLFANNYNAIFGLGSVYMHLQKNTNCAFYLSKSLKINENNIFLKILSVRYLLKIDEVKPAYSIICNGLEITDKSYQETIRELKNKKMKKDEETLCLEFIDILLQSGMMNEAKEVLNICRYKDDFHHAKNKKVETYKAQKIKTLKHIE